MRVLKWKHEFLLPLLNSIKVKKSNSLNCTKMLNIFLFTLKKMLTRNYLIISYCFSTTISKYVCSNSFA